MRIHRVLTWGVVTALVLAVCSIATSVWYKGRIETLDVSQRHVRIITRSVSGLLAMEQDSVSHYSPRVSRQWHAIHAELARALNALAGQRYGKDGVNQSASTMVAVVEALPAQYDAVVTETSNTDSVVERDRRDALIDHLTIETRRVSDDAFELAERLEELRTAARNAYVNLQFVLILAFVLFIVNSARFIYRRVLKPVETLTAIAFQMQAGDMEVRSGLIATDEMGILGRTFDEMTVTLQEKQQSLMNSQRETATFYNTLNQHSIVSFSDKHGNITLANDEFCRISGYSREELVGKDHRILNSGAQSDAFWVEFWDTINRGQPWRGEICNRTKDGTLYWVDSIVVPIMGNFGLVNKYISIRNDITVRKEAEAALRELNHSLEQRVTDRTQELSLALHSAQTASRSRAEFLANTSHEIRTPMNSVLGMAYLALQHTTDPQQRVYLTKIERSGSHLMYILDDILDISKIDAGKLVLEKGSFDLDNVLDHVLHLTEDRAKEKGLNLRMERGNDMPRFLLGDGVRVKQIMLNFASNAVKFTAKGEVVITLHALPCEPSFCMLRFEVTDTGIGLTETEIARLFKSFEQADNSVTRKFGGTGLGLAICKQLAELMLGDVGVTSKPGVGSTFWFQARFALGDQAPMAEDNSQALMDAKLTLRGRSILVVDDNEFNLDVACGLLEELGCHITTACNGMQALELLRAGAFDCVLMDVQMPVMDGLEATRQIRTDAALSDTVVIALTANARGEDRELCMQAGMNDVIRKPVEPELMFVTMANWLRGLKHTPAGPVFEGAKGAHGSLLEVDPLLDTLPVWDSKALHRITGDDPAVQSRLLAKYLSTATDVLQEIVLAIERQDWKTAASLGHKLKSSSRSVGAMKLGALCEALERAGDTLHASAYEHYGNQIQAAFEAVKGRILEDSHA